jgi:hypothetical protein
LANFGAIFDSTSVAGQQREKVGATVLHYVMKGQERSFWIIVKEIERLLNDKTWICFPILDGADLEKFIR